MKTWHLYIMIQFECLNLALSDTCIKLVKNRSTSRPLLCAVLNTTGGVFSSQLQWGLLPYHNTVTYNCVVWCHPTCCEDTDNEEFHSWSCQTPPCMPEMIRDEVRSLGESLQTRKWTFWERFRMCQIATRDIDVTRESTKSEQQWNTWNKECCTHLTQT